jgi:hypothetical protein
MTEEEWLACTNPTPLLECVRDRASERKLRLFAVACCRRIWHLMEKGCREAVEAAERFADDPSIPIAPRHAELIDWGEEHSATARYIARAAGYTASFAMFIAGPTSVFRYPCWEAARYARWVARDAGREGEREAQGMLLHDLFANPFRPLPAVAPAWLHWSAGTVLALARTIYEERSFDQLPVLADALEDAGCDNPVILEHLRGPGLHARGCWVLDALLDRR